MRVGWTTYIGVLRTFNSDADSQVEKIWKVRQAAMDRHYADHPDRYVNGTPVVKRPPARVCISPDDGQPAEKVLADPESFKTIPTPVSIELPEVVT